MKRHTQTTAQNAQGRRLEKTRLAPGRTAADTLPRVGCIRAVAKKYARLLAGLGERKRFRTADRWPPSWRSRPHAFEECIHGSPSSARQQPVETASLPPALLLRRKMAGDAHAVSMSRYEFPSQRLLVVHDVPSITKPRRPAHETHSMIKQRHDHEDSWPQAFNN